MKYLFIWLIRFYQKVLSPLKGQPTCRFSPTCSSYAIEAFRKRGAIVGLCLTVARIFRCQPFCAGGYDPVPDKGIFRRRYQATPMTKYYFPKEYGLDRPTKSNTEEL